jgi:hypothetical protein
VLHVVPVPVIVGAAVIFGGIVFGITAGRRDGLSLDMWLLAAARHSRSPRALSTTDARPPCYSGRPGDATAAVVAEQAGLGYSTTSKLRAWEGSGQAERLRTGDGATLWRLTDAGRAATATTGTSLPAAAADASGPAVAPVVVKERSRAGDAYRPPPKRSSRDRSAVAHPRSRAPMRPHRPRSSRALPLTPALRLTRCPRRRRPVPAPTTRRAARAAQPRVAARGAELGPRPRTPPETDGRDH